MKKIQITIAIDEASGKIANGWQTEGYSRENICDLMEMIGLVENFKGVLKDKVKTLMEKKL